MAAVQIQSPTPSPQAEPGLPSQPHLDLPTAGLGRRFASLVYEGLLLTALVLITTFPFVGFTGGRVTPISTLVLQAYLLVVVGTYFTWFWRHGGQTLPMKTWGIRLIRVDGKPLTLKDSVVRYAAAWMGLALAGLGFWWAFGDRDRQFLHDRIAGTRLTNARTDPAAPPTSSASAKP